MKDEPHHKRLPSNQKKILAGKLIFFLIFVCIKGCHSSDFDSDFDPL